MNGSITRLNQDAVLEYRLHVLPKRACHEASSICNIWMSSYIQVLLQQRGVCTDVVLHRNLIMTNHL